MLLHCCGLAALLIPVSATMAAPNPSARAIPHPWVEHPGNVFLSGEEVVVPLPAGGTNEWRLVDYHNQPLRTVPSGETSAQLGRLPVGFYRLRPPMETHSNWISLAVLEPLQAPTPTTSPIALDVAMAWFYPTQRMDAVAHLCALAGVNWVRDRLNWGEVEPRRGEFKSAPTRYDVSAEAQSRAGLQVLQVNHSSPRWAAESPKRFPEDLRDVFNFYREMAHRWRGTVRAFEPWNEADIPMFGGHTGAEMAALQKAAYLGLKAGNPEGIVGQNVFASHNVAQLEDLRDNAAAPYFDTFNLHHYEAFDSYPRLYADFRAVSAGKPLWVTEAARPVKWSDDRSKEPSDADLREQAERLVKTFALGLHEGAAAFFYFVLPHYVEGPTQFGVLRADLTPRPAFVSLAAVGRLLADAKALGKSATTNAGQHAVWFKARPDGNSSEVLIAWADHGEPTLELPTPAERVFDHLGRPIDNTQTILPGGKSARLALKPAPVFAVFPNGTFHRLNVTRSPQAPAVESKMAAAHKVVLQAVWPETNTMLKRSAYRIASNRRETIPVWAYNFGDQPVRGTLKLSGPEIWLITAPAEIEIPPGGRERINLAVTATNGTFHPIETLRMTGDFGSAGEAIMSLRLLPEPFRPAPGQTIPLPGLTRAQRWRPMISGGGACAVIVEADRVHVSAEPSGPDRWFYPISSLSSDERPPKDATGLMFTFALLEGTADFRVICDEQNGSSYVMDLDMAPKLGEAVEAMVLFSDAAHGTGWSKPDSNHQLDPGEVVSLKIGGNTKANRVKYRFGNLRWVKF